MISRSPRPDLRGLVLPVGLVIAAEFAVWTYGLRSDSIAAPSEVATAWFGALIDGTLIASTVETLICALAGLTLGFSIGIVIGVMIGVFRLADSLAEVTIESVRPVPPVALIPIALLIYGFGYRLEIAVVAFATIWPAMIFTRSAIRSITPRLFEVAAALDLSFRDKIFKIVIPAALPQIFVALRLSAAVSLIVAVTVEITSNTIGLGHTMMEAQSSLHPDLMLAMLVWIGVIGWMLNQSMLQAQSRLFPYSVADFARGGAR
ncbi:ABC transporter permease [Rhizobium rhizogenes]|uniref:ABC transporter permease n=1 Tax=Rhizobium rhizogenes TaxID=359 RepID=UPI00157336D0|nr:ABC transporter permease subunit [Rhizobium rhizogenes]NTI78467.1 ABC transporter permease subunit [Rhizobium rhizogenes]